MPKISVVTVCRNEGVNVEKTLQSIFSQTFSEYEVIVIDGASSDDTVAYIKKYEERLGYFISEPDSGIFNAQNKGWKKAAGEYVLFLNAGDYLVDKDVFLKFSQSLSGIDIVYGDMIVRRPTGREEVGLMPESLSLSHMLAATLWHPVSFIRRDLLVKLRGYEESYKIAADYEFFLRALFVNSASTVHLPVKVCIFSADGVSSDTGNKELHASERARAQKALFSRAVLDLNDELASWRSQYALLSNSLAGRLHYWLVRLLPIVYPKIEAGIFRAYKFLFCNKV